jgi:hypothetical protein
MVEVSMADLELAVDYFQDRNAGDWEVVERWRAILLAAPSAGGEECSDQDGVPKPGVHK